MTQIVSYSELAAYRKCPLTWFLGYHRRWVAPPKADARSRGTLWHAVMEIHYRELMAIQQLMREHDLAPPVGLGYATAWSYDLDVARIDRGAVGSIAERVIRLAWQKIAPLLYDQAGNQSEQQELVEWAYRGYLDWYGLDPTWTILAVEHAPVMWLPTARGTRSGYQLKMKLDLIVQELATGNTWIVDHKFSTQKPSKLALEIDDQFGLYTWGLRTLGRPAFGSIHSFCKAEKLKRAQTPQERFIRTPMLRSEAELTAVAVDAWRTAVATRQALRQIKAEADANPIATGVPGNMPLFSAPNPMAMGCSMCDYSDAHVAARKGWIGIENYLADTGFKREMERH